MGFILFCFPPTIATFWIGLECHHNVIQGWMKLTMGDESLGSFFGFFYLWYEFQSQDMPAVPHRNMFLQVSKSYKMRMCSRKTYLMLHINANSGLINPHKVNKVNKVCGTLLRFNIPEGCSLLSCSFHFPFIFFSFSFHEQKNPWGQRGFTNVRDPGLFIWGNPSSKGIPFLSFSKCIFE